MSHPVNPDNSTTARPLSWLLTHLPPGLVIAPSVASGDDPLVLDVVADSRQVRPSTLFVAVSGGSRDGHAYIPAAVEHGAAALIGTKTLAQLIAAGHASPDSVPYVQVSDSRGALAWLAAALNDFPSRDLAVVGVTGSDG